MSGVTPALLGVLALTAAAVILFVTEWLPPALVALLVMAALLVSGVVTPEQGFSGFSDPATLAVAAMFVLSAGLERTGLVDDVGQRVSRLLEEAPRRGWLVLLVGTALCSGFVNNTAVVAVLIPILVASAQRSGTSVSRLLMPVSFASMLGGVCTLMGTSTNLIVSSVAEERGARPFGFFEMAPLGAIFAVVGLVYLVVAKRWIPERRGGEDLAESFEIGRFLTRVRLSPEAPSVGRALGASPLVTHHDLEVVSVLRDAEPMDPRDELELAAGDVLWVRGPRDAIHALEVSEGLVLGLGDMSDVDLEDGGMMLVEAVVSPRSSIAGQPLSALGLRDRLGAVLLALRHSGEVEHDDIDERRLVAGDVILLLVPRDRRHALERERDLVLVSGEPLAPPHPQRRWVALALVVAVVAFAAADLIPVGVGAPVAAVLMVVTGCLELDDAYQAIDADVVFLLAGMLALGVAFGETGADALMSELFASVHRFGETALVGSLYLVTLILTSTMSNQATAALLTPIALSTAQALALDARPLLFTVMFAASSSFLTPVGYQTNTMVYGPGKYRFSDFLRIGGGLSLLLAVLATLLIPALWPLHG